MWVEQQKVREKKGEAVYACEVLSKNQLTSESDQNNNRLAPSTCDLLREKKEIKKNTPPLQHAAVKTWSFVFFGNNPDHHIYIYIIDR